MKKIVLKLAIPDGKARQKAMKVVSKFLGIVSIAADMKEEKLTVIGDVDPVKLVSALRKKGYVELVSVGPAKKDEGNKDDNKIPEFYYPPYYNYPCYNYITY